MEHTETMPHILLAGAPTGCWTNLGDEAILAGMAASLRGAIPGAVLTVVSSSPAGTFEPYGCEAVRFDDLAAVMDAVAAADLVLLGGGSIFFDYWGCDPSQVLTPRHQGLSLWTGLALLAAADGTPVMVHGAGVGPLRSADGELLASAAFELAGAVTLRDDASRRALAGLGLDGVGEVTGDPALGVALPEVAPLDLPRPLIGVSVRAWDVDVDPDAWTTAVAGALDDALARTGGTAVFVPCHRAVSWPLTDDEAAADAVRARMARADQAAAVAIERPWPERAAVLAACDQVLAMRYHAALFALRAGVPTVGLSYDPKVRGLFEEWDLASLVVDVADADIDGVASRLARLRDEPALGPFARATGARLWARERTTAHRAAALLDSAPSAPSAPSVAAPGGPAVGALLARLAVEGTADRPARAAAALDRLRRRLPPDSAPIGAPVRAALAGAPPTPDLSGSAWPAPAGPPPPPRGRVAILTNRLLDRDSGEPRIGGAERYGLALAQLLADLGFEPTFFQGGGSWEVGDFFGFPVVALPFGEEVSEFQVGVGEAFHERTAGYDHVIYLMPNYASGPLREDAVVVSHGVWWDHDLWGHLRFRTPEWEEQLARVFTRPRRVVSVDHNSINVVRALFPEAADRMTCIPSAVDTERFHPPADRRIHEPLVVFPRRADIIRGVRLVGPLLDQVPDPCRFAWVGDGDPALVDELAAVAARDDRLTVRSATFDEMPEVYRDADICVIPTVASEGQSLACLEAMASGCAVVVTRVGGLPELVTDEVDGLVCDPTPASLAAAVRRLVRDPELRRRLGTAARESAERRSLVAWRARWAEVLAELGWIDAPTAAVPYDIVCFSIINWEFRWQRPQQLAAAWARRGRRVFYLRVTDPLPLGGEPLSVRPLAEGVWEVRLALPEGFDAHQGLEPDGFREAAQAALDALRERWGIERAVSVVELATWAPVAAAARDAFGWPVVYDCMDDWSTFPGFAERPHVLAMERELVAGSDVVVVSSRTIQERWATERADLVLARNAADFAFFHDGAGDDPLADVTGPVAGFFGAVVEWFDVALMAEVARARPEVTFVFVGGVARVAIDELAALPNVRFVGAQPYEDMPRYLRRFDVALVPFVVSPTTDGMDVVKLYEYLSQGTPVVSTPIREMVPYGRFVHLAGDAAGFVEQLDRALAEDDPSARDRRVALARCNSWDDRIDLIEREVLPALAPRVAHRSGSVTAGAGALFGWRSPDPVAPPPAAGQEELDALRHELEAFRRSRVLRTANLYWRGRRAFDRRVLRRADPTG